MVLESPIIAAIEGDQTTDADGVLRAVGPRCECARVGYWCLTHRQRLANTYQAELHVEQGRHTVARDCCNHGINAL